LETIKSKKTMKSNDLSYGSIDKRTYTWIILISVVVPILVAALIYMPKINVGNDWIYFLPHLNAVINSAATIALIFGLYFIKRKNIIYHKLAMSTAFGLGAIFMFSYVIYHATAESTSFGGEGMVRNIYYFVLITHIILAAVALFPILLAYYYGYTGRVERHRKVVRYAYPIWLYVTVSGVLVYLMISPYYNF
jgi:putative membrane protein